LVTRKYDETIIGLLTKRGVVSDGGPLGRPHIGPLTRVMATIIEEKEGL